MFLSSHLHFGCYLQCFLLPTRILAAIYNLFCSSAAFWMLFVMFSPHRQHFGYYLQCFPAPRPHFGRYLQCFLLLGRIVAAMCNVFCSSAAFCCYLQCFLLLGSIWGTICNVFCASVVDAVLQHQSLVGSGQFFTKPGSANQVDKRIAVYFLLAPCYAAPKFCWEWAIQIKKSGLDWFFFKKKSGLDGFCYFFKNDGSVSGQFYVKLTWNWPTMWVSLRSV